MTTPTPSDARVAELREKHDLGARACAFATDAQWYDDNRAICDDLLRTRAELATLRQQNGILQRERDEAWTSWRRDNEAMQAQSAELAELRRAAKMALTYCECRDPGVAPNPSAQEARLALRAALQPPQPAAAEAEAPAPSACWNCGGKGYVEHRAQQMPEGPTVYGYARASCPTCGGKAEAPAPAGEAVQRDGLKQLWNTIELEVVTAAAKSWQAAQPTANGSSAPESDTDHLHAAVRELRRQVDDATQRGRCSPAMAAAMFAVEQAVQPGGGEGRDG